RPHVAHRRGDRFVIQLDPPDRIAPVCLPVPGCEITRALPCNRAETPIVAAEGVEKLRGGAYFGAVAAVFVCVRQPSAPATPVVPARVPCPRSMPVLVPAAVRMARQQRFVLEQHDEGGAGGETTDVRPEGDT